MMLNMMTALYGKQPSYSMLHNDSRKSKGKASNGKNGKALGKGQNAAAGGGGRRSRP